MSGSGKQRTRVLAHHESRCRICRHPARREIEEAFLDWMNPRKIEATWKAASYGAIYRHAHATGLFERRKKNWRRALVQVIERVDEVQVTTSAVIAAIRLSAQLERECGGAASKHQPRKLELSLGGTPRTAAVTGEPAVAVEQTRDGGAVDSRSSE